MHNDPDFLEFVDNLKRDLRIHGYSSVLNEHFNEDLANEVRKHLFADFRNIPFIEVTPEKKVLRC